MMNFFKFGEFKKNAAEKKEFGSNIKAAIEFKRHQDPGKTPEGMSADWLTEKGQEASRQDAQGVEEMAVGGYASPKLRAQETVDLMLDNVDDGVAVINKKIEELSGPAAEARSDKQRGGNEFRIKTKKELDATANFSKVMPLASAWADEQIAAGVKLDKYSLIVQWYLDNPEICRENGVLTGRETAAEIAERAATELGMTERFYSGSEVRLINVTHGPKLEPFLAEVIGLKNVEEMGGALKPGESFQFAVNIDENKKKEVKLLFRGQEYAIDENQIKSLAQEYRDRIAKD